MNTQHFLNRVMGNLFRTQTTPALPTRYWVGLSSTEPNYSGAGFTEPTISTGTGYARVELTSLSTPADGVITNDDEIQFPRSMVDWGTMTHYLIFDAETGGNLLMYGELTKSRIVEDNTILSFEEGELTLTLRNPE